MSIIWKYLDKRSAAVDALKDYSNMKFIIEDGRRQQPTV